MEDAPGSEPVPEGAADHTRRPVLKEQCGGRAGSRTCFCLGLVAWSGRGGAEKHDFRLGCSFFDLQPQTDQILYRHAGR